MFLTFLRRYALVVLLAAAGIAWMYVTVRQARADTDLARLERDRVVLEARGYKTQLASTTVDRNALRASLEAEQVLHGTLLAAAKLHVASRDTVVVHDSLPTTRQADSTRVATFRDSTFAGVVSGQITAPPYPAALRLDSLRVSRPAFDPEVAFVQTGSVVTAVVKWQGEQAEILNAFALPQRASLPRMQRFVEALVQQDGTWTARGGVELRLPLGLSAVATGQQRLVGGERFNVQLGARKQF